MGREGRSEKMNKSLEMKGQRAMYGRDRGERIQKKTRDDRQVERERCK